MVSIRILVALLLVHLLFSGLSCSTACRSTGLSADSLRVSEIPGNVVRTIAGADCTEFHNGRVEGTGLKLNPDGGGGIAWAMYEIDETPGLRPRDLVFSVEADTGTEYWVGLANYTRGTWEMFTGNSNEDLVINLYESWDIYNDHEGVVTYIVVVPAYRSLTLTEVFSRSNTCSGFTVPAAPDSVAATDGDFPDRIRVSWEQVQYCPNYRIWRADSMDGEPVEESWKPVHQTQRLSFIDRNVIAGDEYHYRVAGMNEHGFGDFSVTEKGSAATP